MCSSFIGRLLCPGPEHCDVILFNSIEFLLFLPCIFAAYWILNVWTDRPKVLRAQNLLILAASYLFYGWWDWRFLSLIAFSTIVDFFVGLQIEKANANELTEDAPPKARSQTAKRWLWVSLAVNLGLLGYFKYTNFFIESWVDAWAAAGVAMNASTLQIILPIGISFYTFQTCSYSIDIYRRTLQPTRDSLPWIFTQLKTYLNRFFNPKTIRAEPKISIFDLSKLEKLCQNHSQSERGFNMCGRSCWPRFTSRPPQPPH